MWSESRRAREPAFTNEPDEGIAPFLNERVIENERTKMNERVNSLERAKMGERIKQCERTREAE